MSTPFYAGLEQGMERLRQWTTSTDNQNDFSHQQRAFMASLRDKSDRSDDPFGHRTSAYQGQPFSSAPYFDYSPIKHDADVHQYDSTEPYQQSSDDLDGAMRELFPGMQCMPPLGHYDSAVDTPVDTPTSVQTPYQPMPTSAPHLDISKDTLSPEPSEIGSYHHDYPYQSYARLLFACLYEAPQHERSLKDIYRWMQDKAKKGRAGDSAGWMNSVRHNLSMNAAFQRIPSKRASSKKDSTWKLTPEAAANGVFSTTRYRTKEHKKSTKHLRDRDSKRVAAGAKGGLASRKSAESNRRRQTAGSAEPPQIVSRPLLQSCETMSSTPASHLISAPRSSPIEGPRSHMPLPLFYNEYLQNGTPSAGYPQEAYGYASDLMSPTTMTMSSIPEHNSTNLAVQDSLSGVPFEPVYGDGDMAMLPLFGADNLHAYGLQ